MRRIKVLSFVTVLGLAACAVPAPVLPVSPMTPSIPISSPSESPRTVSSSSPLPSPSTYTRIQFTRDLSPKLVAPVGANLDLVTSVSPDQMPTWRLEDPTMAILEGRFSDWNIYVAGVHLLKPGGVYIRAELNDEAAEAFVASIDPKTTSIPIALPAGIPRETHGRVPNGVRVITTETAWKSFVEEVTTQPVEVPDIEFRSRSIVAVVADWSHHTDLPVVTHIDRTTTDTLTVVQPWMYSRMAPTSGAQVAGLITVLEVPRVATDAKVVSLMMPAR